MDAVERSSLLDSGDHGSDLLPRVYCVRLRRGDVDIHALGRVVADRVPRRLMIVVTQSLSMLLALVLSALAFMRIARPWHIIMLAFFPRGRERLRRARAAAFVLEMVEPKRSRTPSP